jgi:sec-independent protein translocase protein TatC
MASALDEDTAKSLARGRQTLWSMLSAAQTHLKKVFLVFVTGMMLTIWALRAFVWDRLQRDLVFSRMNFETAEATEIIVVTPFDVILLQVKIGIAVGVLISLPMLVWYSRDGLKRRGYWPASKIPRWKLVLFGISIILLFLGGMSYAYFLFFPIMFDFLAANAVRSGFKPTWSIVMWTEFIFFLALSFGLAAQLPLAMSGSARTGIVKYETFRDKWRYAVLGIFVFGAMFSPPDPFTQVMWGVPLVALYVISLGVTKVAVLSKQAGELVPVRNVMRKRWNHLAGVFVLATAGVYAYLLEGGLAASNDALESIGSSYRVVIEPADLGVFGLPPAVLATSIGLVVGLFVSGVALFYFRTKELERQTRIREESRSVGASAGTETQSSEGQAAEPQSEPGQSAVMDIGAMSAPALEAASVEAFAELSEQQAIQHAEQAVENENPEKARTILDRFEEAQEREQEDDEPEEEEENVVTSTAAGMLDPFTEDDTSEDDIGGYYYDIRFILDSLTSRAIWLVGTFIVVMAATFMFLYTGGIKTVRDVFFGNMPDVVETPNIVVLHPVEALIFMLKFSMLLGGVAVLPLLLYFAWPAIEDRGISTGDRHVLLVWGGTMFVALVGGTLLGFLYVAPTILSLLAHDVVTSNMIVAYRISSFGWLVIYLTVGIGAMTMIPVTMVLFHHGNIISYRRMQKSWRGVVLAFFAAAGFLSPQGIFTMFLVAIPASLAYLFGLGLLWIYTRVGSTVPSRRSKTAD